MLTYNISNLDNIDVDEIKELIDANEFGQLMNFLLQSYESLGPLPGFLLPFIEAFLPFLPVIVFVMTNAAAYGLWEGFLLSWTGASSGGAIAVFMLVRRFRHLRLFRWISRNKQVTRVTTWLERHGFGPLFLLLCFPFSPSAVINLVAAISSVGFYQFLLAVLLGKGVMILAVASIGDSIVSFAQNPVKTIILAIAITVLWIVGKYIEKYLQKKVEEKGGNKNG
ncbi:alkaline phosphatase like protein [Gracilibacillus boraciitolerans JCM 21714]|uniref:TVP38/TMEM64 family membrane protein n=1 Tax=Gracilibacillus boraciitolerans JCM 21714 TaxID=1298598 RepID=W4VJP8_9BACI|nr:TVP38/TMEM64 family protein [Gracilibacillus boraciitolerans]GAE93630.1 alkaline phosphatase like protein [Gracilibacillus boraciitolerans JCM 21714]